MTILEGLFVAGIIGACATIIFFTMRDLLKQLKNYDEQKNENNK